MLTFLDKKGEFSTFCNQIDKFPTKMIKLLPIKGKIIPNNKNFNHKMNSHPKKL